MTTTSASVHDPSARLARVLETVAGVSVQGPPVESYGNDVYLATHRDRGPCVLRICWIGRRSRVLTEAMIGELCHDIGYPRVLGYGTVSDLSWTLTKALPGMPLAGVWDGLDTVTRQAAAAQTADLLRNLHAWHAPDVVRHCLRKGLDDDDVVGSTINPLPLDRLRRLVERGVPGLDRARRAKLNEWFANRAGDVPSLDDPRTSVTHGDLHLGNIWWDGSRVVGLIDLEWARFGDPLLDLARVWDIAHDGSAEAPAHHELLAGLLTAYPQVRGERDEEAVQRALEVVGVAHWVRQAFVWPPLTEQSPADHPVRALRRVLDGKTPQDSVNDRS